MLLINWSSQFTGASPSIAESRRFHVRSLGQAFAAHAVKCWIGSHQPNRGDAVQLPLVTAKPDAGRRELLGEVIGRIDCQELRIAAMHTIAMIVKGSWRCSLITIRQPIASGGRGRKLGPADAAIEAV